MRLKFSFFLTGIILVSLNSLAQNEDDVLRYTQLRFGGSARNLSLAGTIAGLGGDFSAVQTNPAALARLKKTLFSFTSYAEIPKSESSFYDQSFSKVGSAVKVGSISYVKAYTLDPKKFNNWFNVQLGLGYERINSFEARQSYLGEADSSILHSFANEAQGTPSSAIYDLHPFRAGLAWDVFALDPGTVPNTYVPTFNAGKVMHNRTTDSRGGMGEYNFVASGNYADKLYIGGTFKVTRIKFTEEFSHRETYVDSLNYLNSIHYFGDLSIKGWGLGARIGAMYVPVDHVRMGLSFQSPTFFKLQDIWSTNMSANTDDPIPFNEKTVAPENVPRGKFDYRLVTPLRLNLDFGYIYKKAGAFSMGIEYVDYRNGKLSNISTSSNPADYINVNNQVDNIYTSAINLRLGLEARLTAGSYARIGYANYGSPYKKDKGNATYSSNYFTAGLGFNTKSYYMDLAYCLGYSKSDKYSYDPTINGSKVSYVNLDSRVAITFGLRLE